MTKRKRRVLIVTPTFTNPPSQGNSARILAFGRELKARGVTVDVLYYVLDQFNQEIEAQMRAEWAELHLVSAQPHSQQKFPACWGLDDWCPPMLVKAVGDLCRKTAYDAVITNYVWLSACLEEVRGPLKILDTHDLFGGRHQLSLSVGMEPSWFFTTEREEARGFDRADLVVGIQFDESAHIAEQTRAKVITVGHPVEPHFLFQEDAERKSATFGYFASGNPWNVASIAAFDEKLATKTTHLDWAIGGSICKALPRLAGHPKVLGLVSDPWDFYQQVDCALNPMMSGTGLKIKTVEALAYGRAVIGTDHAFKGFHTEHWAHKLTGPAEVADAAFEYQSSNSLREELYAFSRKIFGRYMIDVNKSYDELYKLIVS
ncbi:glycosyltransferase [uncultured Brevundimonas sp.]|uniref:glycosyltransferase n=1 Tax=uncultured Brevundimonas sp. TaxID=213418 RepID=UPI0025EC8AC8|nr:glycosyltransferase [uncultured Brevundimonas sp.]